MKNIFETVKKSQMAPVRGRVKAMMAQPRAIPQARKIARQTTGFKQGGAFLPLRGGVTTAKAFRGSEGFKQSQKLQKKLLGTTVGKRKLSLEEKLRMQAKGVINKKTGRLIPAHEAVMKGSSSKQVNFMAKKGYNPKLFKGKPKPGPLATKQDVKKSLKETKLEAKYFKEMKAKGIKKSGGVIQKQAGGTIGFARGGVPEDKKKRKPSPQPGLRRPKPKPGPTPAQPRPKAGPPAGRPEERPKAPEGGRRPSERPQAPKAGPPAGRPQAPKKKKEGMYVKKGGVVQKVFLGKLMEMFGKGKKATAYGDPANQGGPEPTRKQTMDVFKDKFAGRHKKGGKVDKKWIQGAVNPKHKGYCTPMTKPTCTPARKRLAKLFKSKAKKGWANGGTVVMPTVGKDSFMRTYKHGAVISPRPRPTVPHGSRMRGTGIAKRGW